MSNKTIQRRFFFVAALSILVLLGFTYTFFWMSSVKAQQISLLRNIAEITQRHMEGDMMHDAIRADVMAALLSQAKNDTAGVSQSQKDFNDHYSKFQENLEANRAEQLPDDVKKMFDSTLVALHNYGASAKAVIGAAATGSASDDSVKDFGAKFSAMEAENERISEAIGDWAKDEENKATAVSERAKGISIALSIFAVFMALFVPVYGRMSIFMPLGHVIRVMLHLAENRLDTEVPLQDKDTEIGDIARTVQVFKQNALETERLRALQKQQEENVAAERRKAMQDLAKKFENDVGNIIDNVSASADEMQMTARALAGTAEDTSSKATNVAAAAEQASANVRSVASASEELAASINEISGQVGKSSRVAAEAKQKATATSGKMKELITASQRIGEVMTLINEIAEQTNLLALNATIEAARAGEAGKGFAVVASEVKNLAAQTAKATEDISQQINDIQRATQDSGKAIQEITEVIDMIDQIATLVAAAVEEQGAATREISRNVQEASTGTQDVTINISKVTSAAGETGSSANLVLDAAQDLAQQSAILRKAVDGFLGGIRA